MNDGCASAGHGGEGAASSTRAGLSEETRRLVAAVFDTSFYLEQYADVREAGVDPVVHYLESGWREGRDPSPTFCTNDYLRENADVVPAGICPLVHYVTAGIFEGRAPQSRQRRREPRRLGEAPVAPAERRRTFARVPAVEPLARDALERVIACVAEHRPAGIAISLSHDDYMTVVGGVQNCVRDEARALREKGWSYLHLCPVQPLLTLAEPALPESFFSWLRLNEEKVGAVTIGRLVAAISHGRFGNSRRVMIMHHLMGFPPESVIDVARAFAPQETVAWVHDFFTLCPNYALLHNEVAFCGAPAPNSNACRTCIYGGAERERHLARLKHLFEALNPTVLTPSDAALEFWRARGRLAHASAHALPHGTLSLDQALRRPEAAPERPLRVGFIGFPIYHKGWPVFERLALLHEGDPRYAFFRLGTVPADEPSNVAFVEIAMDPERRDSMIDAVVTNAIDVVVNWALCFETFSFSAHEAMAGGAFVLAPKWAGNIAPAITRAKQGLALDSEQELFDLFAAGKVFEVIKQRCYGELVRRPATAAYVEP
jgi:hypothetical protein